MPISNCALYFPIEKAAFKSVFPAGRSDGGFFRSATWFEFDTPDGPIRLSLGHPDFAGHLAGFRAYVAQLPANGDRRARALHLISATKSTAGVILPKPIEESSEAFSMLRHLLAKFDGFLFVNDGILLADGTVLVGPTTSDFGDEEGEEPPLVAVSPSDCRHLGPTEGVPPERVAMREEHYRLLAERGFRCSRGLPLVRSEGGEFRLRPISEIASRLFALDALFLYVAGSEESVAENGLLEFVERNGLLAHLAGDEPALLALPRAEAHSRAADVVGWRLENMWPLAWILGFDPPPPFHRGQIPQPTIDALLFEFLPGFDVGVERFLSNVRPRSTADVARLEDLYYCAHNAVRSAQLGRSTVPRSFHPVRDGGAVHERRHALTWAISPGVAWSEADLST